MWKTWNMTKLNATRFLLHLKFNHLSYMLTLQSDQSHTDLPAGPPTKGNPMVFTIQSTIQFVSPK